MNAHGVIGLREVSIATADWQEGANGLGAITGHPGFETQEEPLAPIESRFRSYPIGDRSLALMESMGENTAISRFIERRGAGLFSLTLAVADLDRLSASLRAGGAQVLLEEPIELRDVRSGAMIFERIRINFVSPAGPLHGIVIELQELHRGTFAGSPEEAASNVPSALNEVHCAVNDVDVASRELADLFGFEIGPVVVQEHPPEEVRFRNLYVDDNRPLLAIIQPATETSSIHRFLSRRGEGMFSVSMRVTDGVSYAERLRDAGVAFLFDEAKIASETRIGPAEVNKASIQWIKPQPASSKALIEIQEYA